jgi:hypothetical protein
VANSEHLSKLRQGVSTWNRWRAQNPDVQPDLEGAELSGCDLSKADLQRANLVAADLTEASLYEADLREADLRRANLARANLCSAYLWGADLQDAKLERANLREASLNGAYLNGTNLRGADLTGANLDDVHDDGADWEGARRDDGLSRVVEEVAGAIPSPKASAEASSLVPFDGFARLKLIVREGTPTRVLVEILGALDRLHRETTGLDSTRPTVSGAEQGSEKATKESGIWQ